MPAPRPEGPSSTGLDVPVAAMLTYLLGFLTGLFFLSIERSSAFVRFHAYQSTLVSLSLIAIDVLLQALPFGGALVVFVMWPIGLALWVFLMFTAFRGQAFELPVIGEFAARRVQ
jgi:uncharacterized membrane protein